MTTNCHVCQTPLAADNCAMCGQAQLLRTQMRALPPAVEHLHAPVDGSIAQGIGALRLHPGQDIISSDPGQSFDVLIRTTKRHLPELGLQPEEAADEQVYGCLLHKVLL